MSLYVRGISVSSSRRVLRARGVVSDSRTKTFTLFPPTDGAHVYASLTGTSRRFATSLREKLNAASSETFELVDAKNLDDPERVLASGRDVIAIFVVSTHEGGEAPEYAAVLLTRSKVAALSRPGRPGEERVAAELMTDRESARAAADQDRRRWC